MIRYSPCGIETHGRFSDLNFIIRVIQNYEYPKAFTICDRNGSARLFTCPDICHQRGKGCAVRKVGVVIRTLQDIPLIAAPLVFRFFAQCFDHHVYHHAVEKAHFRVKYAAAQMINVYLVPKGRWQLLF